MQQNLGTKMNELYLMFAKGVVLLLLILNHFNIVLHTQPS